VRVEDETTLRWESMLSGIRAQADWLARGPSDAVADARSALSGPPPQCVYLVGCGDSHYCGLSARLAFETWSGASTQALPALEFARYVVDGVPPGAWVVCVSNSGRVARTVEAARRARERGLTTIAVTYAPESPLAETAETTLCYRYPDPGFGPGTISYIASLTVLYAIALRAAELTGGLDADDGAVRLAALEAQADVVARTLELAWLPAEELGRETPLDVPIHLLGAGPSLGTASFGRAKLIEAAGVAAGVHELEEWAHEQFFCTGPGTLTIVVAPPGAAAARAVEQLKAIREMGGTAVALCPAGAAAAASADRVLPVADDPPEELSPLAYSVPLALFALQYASLKGLTMFGFDDERRRRVNARQIFVPR
jgi:glutamine---fructose-6-phosphate transaminase (isomerizing)